MPSTCMNRRRRRPFTMESRESKTKRRDGTHWKFAVFACVALHAVHRIRCNVTATMRRVRIGSNLNTQSGVSEHRKFSERRATTFLNFNLFFGAMKRGNRWCAGPKTSKTVVGVKIPVWPKKKTLCDVSSYVVFIEFEISLALCAFEILRCGQTHTHTHPHWYGKYAGWWLAKGKRIEWDKITSAATTTTRL